MHLPSTLSSLALLLSTRVVADEVLQPREGPPHVVFGWSDWQSQPSSAPSNHPTGPGGPVGFPNHPGRPFGPNNGAPAGRFSTSTTTKVTTTVSGNKGSTTIVNGASGTTKSSTSDSVTYKSITTASPVSYTGTDIIGTTTLPAWLSKVVFPTDTPEFSFPYNPWVGRNNLPQGNTNGKGNLGTFGAPRFPPWIGGPASGSSNNGAPWWPRNANGTNPYNDSPRTGVVRKYNFNIARGVLAPDGVERNMLLVNGAFPGPTIEANWGDTIQVTVTNNITGPEEGTALHWHGLLQKGTPYEDGVPGITQCPIAPGETFTYSFIADLYGTSWYHSHYSAQYAGGVFGAMIIHGPTHVPYDSDLGPVLLTDYYHDDYYSIVEDIMGTDLSKIAPASDNNLINGKNNFDCSVLANSTKCTPNAGLSKFQFETGKTYRLRLINAGAEGIQRFQLDNHVIKVIAYDFVPIQPYTVTQVTLGVGQRADILVTATGKATDAVWMRSTISSTCSLSHQPNALAIVYYQNANTTAEPTTTATPLDDTTCANDDLSKTVPYFALAPPKTNVTQNVDLSFKINSTGNFVWTMDGSSFRTDYNNPILPQLEANNASANIASFPREWNVYDFGSNNSFIIVVNNKNPIAHPMHIHGHNMFVLSEGSGSWDGTITGNSSNPARRDVQILPPSGHIAIQVQADNPGVWPFHCHIAWHVSGGLYLNILERPADIKRTIHTPGNVQQLCRDWDAWTKTQSPNQIDSGLKIREFEGRKRRFVGGGHVRRWI